MPSLNPKKIIEACIMSFQGTPDKIIANELEIHTSTLSRWRSLDLWQQTHDHLVNNFIESVQVENLIQVKGSLTEND